MSITRKSFFLLLATAMLLPFFATPAFADDGTAALDFIPKDTMMVISMDVDGMRGSDMFKQFMSAAMSDPDTKKDLDLLKAATGFDAEKDISSIVIAVPPDVEKTENFLVIAKAKVDEAKVMAYAKKEGGEFKEMSHEGVTWYEIDNEGGIAFMGPHIVLGTTAALKAAIATKKGSMKNASKGSVGPMLKAVDTKADVWFAMAIPEILRKQMGAADPMAGEIQSAHASMDLATGLALKITVNATTAEIANQLVEVGNAGLQGVGADPSMKQMGLDAALTKLVLKADGKAIKVGLNLTKAELAKIEQALAPMLQGM